MDIYVTGTIVGQHVKNTNTNTNIMPTCHQVAQPLKSDIRQLLSVEMFWKPFHLKKLPYIFHKDYYPNCFFCFAPRFRVAKHCCQIWPSSALQQLVKKHTVVHTAQCTVERSSNSFWSAVHCSCQALSCNQWNHSCTEETYGCAHCTLDSAQCTVHSGEKPSSFWSSSALQLLSTVAHCTVAHWTTACSSKYKIQNTWQGSLPAALQLPHNLFHLSNFKGLQCHKLYFTALVNNVEQFKWQLTVQHNMLTVQHCWPFNKVKQRSSWSSWLFNNVDCSTMWSSSNSSWLFNNVNCSTILAVLQSEAVDFSTV